VVGSSQCGARLGLHTIATAALYICSRVVDLCRE
jgi:hypothetical protein